MREHRHTWMAGKIKTCERRPKDGGTNITPSYVLHNNSSKGKKMLRDESSWEQRGDEKYGERKKSVKEGKISPFINPRRIKSEPLDYVYYESTARGSETRSTVGIKSLFKNPNQWSRFG